MSALQPIGRLSSAYIIMPTLGMAHDHGEKPYRASPLLGKQWVYAGIGRMKFAYVDESGGLDQGDVFIMAGVLVDAYRLRKYTATFDKMIVDFLAKHPDAPTELKTKAFISGSRGWSKVDATDRKKFLAAICDLVAECGKIFGVAFSFEAFKKAAGREDAFTNSHWLSAAMFIAALVQKKMQDGPRNKGMTVLICDDNKQEMPNLADTVHEAPPWFDPIYQKYRRKRDVAAWQNIREGERFDQIVNCAFAIKSHHSSLIQVADVVSYVYRRHLELKTGKETWDGEQKYFAALVDKLEPRRELLGRNPGGPCIEFYQAACHKDWKL
jgi:hypothetical protein